MLLLYYILLIFYSVCVCVYLPTHVHTHHSAYVEMGEHVVSVAFFLPPCDL